MEKILVSSCLLGEKVRYDGNGKQLINNELAKWIAQGRVVSFCPEVAGGLPIPRDAAEIARNGKVLTASLEDVTPQFQLGAKKALLTCVEHNIKFALLKEGSPSCGRNFIYNGLHQNIKIKGMGLTAQLLEQNGIQVFSEEQINSLKISLEQKINLLRDNNA